MNTKSVKSKRKVGGFGFASSMIRSNIDTGGYLKHITTVINLRLFGNKQILTCTVETTDFELFVQNDTVLNGKLDYIEHCRSITVTEFEKVIIKRLQEAGYEFDTNNEYFRTIFK